MLEIFFSDERVQVIIGELLTKANKGTQAVSENLPPEGTAATTSLLNSHLQQA